uniref:Inositol-tetrakisphosphate 1-kinase n=1 Tax=Phallusia mammillata TaxID=59560 RepID=A0A6F9DGB2_9ASCI|nr:inositol-tetrakisphosphate 1-kinase-like [Phallusia mammillata]
MASKSIGCWFSHKKKKKVNVKQLALLFQDYDASLKEIDLDSDLEQQGPFDAIVHKVTDLMIERLDGNEVAAQKMKDFESYLAKHPNTVVVDPLLSLEKLIKRYETYKLIQETNICSRDKVIQVPTFTFIKSKNRAVILKQMKEADVHFPIVCKKNIAHGTESHKMMVIFNEDGLADVDPPCVAQTFIDHNALLYKIYVIGDKYHMVERPSLRNFSKSEWTTHKTIFFNSHNISSGDSQRSDLTKVEATDGDAMPIDTVIVQTLTKQLYQDIKMTLYGVDIIVCPKTNKHYVIDVNVFPGYDGVDDFLNTLVDCVMAQIKQFKAVDRDICCDLKMAAKTNSVENGHNEMKILNGIRPEVHVNGHMNGTTTNS